MKKTSTPLIEAVVALMRLTQGQRDEARAIADLSDGTIPGPVKRRRWKALAGPVLDQEAGS